MTEYEIYIHTDPPLSLKPPMTSEKLTHEKRFKVLSLSLVLVLNPGLILTSKTAFAKRLERQICSDRYSQFFNSYQPKSPDILEPKIGIEIEGSISDQMNLEGIAKLFQNQLKDRESSVNQKYRNGLGNYYEVVYQNKKGEEKAYRISRDLSIVSKQIPFEIATPILKDPDDFEVFRLLVQELKKTKAKSETRTAGVHVHIDFSNPSFGETASIAALFSEIEEELMKRFSTTSTRRRYTKPTSTELLKILNEVKIDDILIANRQVWRVVLRGSRYHALNLKAHFRYGTLEFRLFNSTLDLPALELMYDFASRLVIGIRAQNPELVAYLVNQNGPIEVDKIAKILGMKLSKPGAQAVLEKILKETQNEQNLKDLTFVTLQSLAFQITALLTTAYVVLQIIEKTNEILGSTPVGTSFLPLK